MFSICKEKTYSYVHQYNKAIMSGFNIDEILYSSTVCPIPELLYNSTIFSLYKYIFQIISLEFIYIITNKYFIFTMQKLFNNVLLLVILETQKSSN